MEGVWVAEDGIIEGHSFPFLGGSAIGWVVGGCSGSREETGDVEGKDVGIGGGIVVSGGGIGRGSGTEES